LPPSSPETTDELQNSLGVKMSSASQVKIANVPNRKGHRRSPLGSGRTYKHCAWNKRENGSDRNQLDESLVDEVVLAPVPNVATTVSATTLSSSTTPAEPTPWATRDRVGPILHHDRRQFQPHRLRVREWMKRKSCTRRMQRTHACPVPRNASITASAVSCLRPGGANPLSQQQIARDKHQEQHRNDAIHGEERCIQFR
jgi:hypothetical protein